MAGVHTVEQGEHIASIAHHYGFADWHIIWDDPANAALRAIPRNPHLLMPGDQIAIPNRLEREEAAATTEVHQFRVKIPPLWLRIAVRDLDDNPVADNLFFLKLKHKDTQGITDAEGMIRERIKPDSHDGNLMLPEKTSTRQIRYHIYIGSLNPLLAEVDLIADEAVRNEAIAGWQDRLNNLGYFAGYTPKSRKQLKWAIEEFQAEHGWNRRDPKKSNWPNGETDERTRAKLEEVHGC